MCQSSRFRCFGSTEVKSLNVCPHMTPWDLLAWVVDGFPLCVWQCISADLCLRRNDDCQSYASVVQRGMHHESQQSRFAVCVWVECSSDGVLMRAAFLEEVENDFSRVYSWSPPVDQFVPTSHCSIFCIMADSFRLSYWVFGHSHLLFSRWYSIVTGMVQTNVHHAPRCHDYLLDVSSSTSLQLSAFHSQVLLFVFEVLD